MKNKTTVFYVLGLLLASVALYGQFLWSPVLFDDLYFFTPTSTHHHPVDQHRYSPFELRSLPLATLAWGKALFGTSIFHFRVVSLLLHAAVTISLFLFLKQLLDAVHSGRSESRLDHGTLAFCAALLFALHPVAVYGAGYLIQRTIVMATLFSLLAMYAWLRGSQHQDKRWLWGGVFCYYLAVFSKEHAIMLPAALFALSVLIHADWRKRMVAYWPQFLAMSLIAGWVILAKKLMLGSVYEVLAPDMLDVNSALNLPLSALTQSWLFFKYAALWVLPNPRWMSADMREPFAQVIASGYLFAFLAFICWGAVSAWLLFKRGRLGLLGFALFFPWVMFLTELSVVRIQEVFVLYRSYLWGVGAFALLPLILGGLDRRLALVVVAAAGIAFVPASLDRLATFAHPLVLWDDAAEKLGGRDDLPGAYRIYYNRGTSFLEIDEYELAVRDLNRAIELNPGWPYPYHNLGSAFGKMSRWQESAEAFSKAIDIESSQNLGVSPSAHFYRAIAYEKVGKPALAREDYAISCRVGKMGCDQLEVLSKRR